MKGRMDGGNGKKTLMQNEKRNRPSKNSYARSTDTDAKQMITNAKQNSFTKLTLDGVQIGIRRNRNLYKT